MNFLRYLISKTLFEPRESDLLLATLFLSRGRKVSATEDSKIPFVLFRRNRRVFEDTIARFVAEDVYGCAAEMESWAESRRREWVALIGGCSRDTNPGARTGIDLDVLSPLSPSSSAGCSPCVLTPLPAASTADSSPGLLPSTNPFFSLLLTK